MLTKPQSQLLAAAHDALNLLYMPAAMRFLETALATLNQDPQMLRTVVPHTTPYALPELPPLPTPTSLEEFPPTYFEADMSASLIHVSPRLLALLEVDDAADLLGHNWEQFLEPDDLRRLRDQWLRAVQTKGGFVHLLTFITPKGRRLVLRESVLPMRDQVTGEHYGWMGRIDVVSRILKMEAAPPSRQQSA